MQMQSYNYYTTYIKLGVKLFIVGECSDCQREDNWWWVLSSPLGTEESPAALESSKSKTHVVELQEQNPIKKLASKKLN